MVALSKGPTLTVSSNAITPTHDIHHVEGEFGGHISTINVPNPDFSGQIVLINETTGLAIWGDGNIDATGGVNFTPKHATIFTYDKDAGKWYVTP